MADIANLVLAVDSSQVAKGTAALDTLTAAGTRAEAATAGLAGGVRGVGTEATAMAAAAQASARAVMGQAAGFGAATEAARLNTIAMRETLVVAREIARGNFTRIPGSLSLLAQGIGSQGGIGAFASAISQQLGLIKTVQNAELAEASAAAASATASVEAAARKAAANVMAADTEVALAEAQLRVTEGTSAEGAAQVRLAEAHQAVAAAAAEAAVAENALATAMGRSSETQAASAAATRTIIGGTGIGLLGIAAVAGIAYGALKKMQDSIKDDGTLTQYRDSLGLTHQEMLKLSDGVEKVSKNIKELGPVTVTFGDLIHGVFAEIGNEASGSAGVSAWDHVKSAAATAFDFILKTWNVTSAALTGGLWTIGDIAKRIFGNFGAIIGDGFYSAVNLAIDAINGLAKAGTDILNSFISAANHIPGVDIGTLGAPKIANVANPYAGAAKGAFAGLQAQADKNYQDALAQNNRAYAGIRSAAISRAENRMRQQANALKGNGRPKKPKKQNDHGAQDALDKLDAEIKGQWALVAAYQAGDAEVIKATAMQKAEEDAISHKSSTGVFYEKELEKAVAERAAAGAKALSDLEFETNARSKVNAMVAAGIIPASQANEQLKLESTLRPLIAAAEAADTAHKQQILDLIKQITDQQGKLNEVTAEAQALQTISANDNDIAKLELENSLLGASNKERAVALAQLEAIQQLNNLGVNDPEARANYVQSAIAKAVAGVQSPFQQWAKDIPQTSAAITEALQGIETRGFDNLAQAITGVVTGTESLGKAFSDVARSIIADIIQMTVKMLIFRALSSVFGGLFGGGGSDIGMANLGSSIYGGGGLTGTVPGFASGGSFIIGGNGGTDNNVLSLNGSPVAMVGQGETLAVYPNSPRPANNNQPQTIELRIATDGNFKAEVAQVAGQVVVTAAPTLVKQATTQTIKTLQRPKISGGR